MDVNVHTFKARLVAKDYTKTYDVDYRETFFPVADIRAIRILLAIVAFYDYEFWQMDVKNSLSKRSPKFNEEIKKIGFTQNPDEPCVYLKSNESSVAFIVLYVDDILLMGNSVTMLQSAYLDKILKKFRMENSKKGYTPMIENPDYRKSHSAKTPSEVQRMQRVPYASAIGSIMYSVRCTRPDVSFTQNLYSHFLQNPGEIHWTVVKTILKYLRNTNDMVFVYGENPEAELKVSCYADSKAEYIVVVEASIEAVWMRKFSDRLGDVIPSNKRPMEMLCDNEPAIEIATNPKILKGARHVQRKYHYIRKVIQEREIVLKKVHTYDNVPDLFTKLMSFNKHFEHAMAIEIDPASSLM
nr:hypothetical protein [Tanacetum cinerariifolium]